MIESSPSGERWYGVRPLLKAALDRDVPTLEEDLTRLVIRLANRDAPRTEAMVQADVRQLLLSPHFALGGGDVRLESQAGDQLRIDVEVGSTVVEVKKDLRACHVPAAVAQLAEYVARRIAKHRTRYVGVLTDGHEWTAYHLVQERLQEVTRIEISAQRPDVSALLVWLEGVLATAKGIPPTPVEIHARLGAGSSAHALDRATLAELYGVHRNSAAVRTRRSLWARLLETALGTQFEDSDELFIEHTLLVNIADLIAHAVLGLDVEKMVPRSILAGEAFQEAEIFGVVEPDFFDWVTEVPGGEGFIRTLARRIARFDWTQVEHDILKVLYESVINPQVRKRLGEYYTPDWLAEKVVESTVPAPLASRVLDPSCGSGTFLFHAVRRYVTSARDEGQSVRQVLESVTGHVVGMDLHPVAVSLARVTYLLAIGTKLLRDRSRQRIRVPVFLGDSLQWRQKEGLFGKNDQLSVPINDQGELFNIARLEFLFPKTLLKDAQKFDALISELAELASARKRHGPRPPLAGVIQRHSVARETRPAVEAAFKLLCDLHDEERNHIWGYYIRNLARPAWLTRPENQVDVLIGNPPWLAYRYMPAPMQADFKAMSETRALWLGARVATSQDLSGLFVVRAFELYLKEGGRFGFVLPSAALDRIQFAGLRKGEFGRFPSAARVTFDPPWDLRKLRPHFFPITASVVFGRKTAKSGAMPRAGEIWSGRVPVGNAPWSEVQNGVIRAKPAKRAEAPPAALSEYHNRFRQGATIVPRFLFFVDKRDAGPLGQSAATTKVISARSANEKRPWKDLEPIEGAVEREFVFRAHLGETVLPYRTLQPRSVVLPMTSKGKLYPGDERMLSYKGLSDWWNQVDKCWTRHRSSERLTLVKRLNYHNELTTQFPVPPLRILYSKAGMHLAAARIDDTRAVIDHKLYWAAAASIEEAHYLCAILNSAVVTARVRPLMSYGKDERDIDKYVWHLPIPMFDEERKAHVTLARLGKAAEEEVSKLPLDGDVHFAASRRVIREWLQGSDVGKEIEAAVGALLREP